MKQQPDKYVPANLPDTLPGLIQFLYDELWRISAAMNKFPTAISVAQTALDVPITPIPTEFRMFEGIAPEYDLPGGGWDLALGEWTCTANGIYAVFINVLVSPFGAGNKNYACELRLYVNDVEAWHNSDAGPDDFELGAALAASGMLKRDDVVRATLTLVHDQFTGDTDVMAGMSITSTALQ